MKTILSLALILILSVGARGQSNQKFTLSGHIKNKANGEALIFTNVFVKELQIGTMSNEYGFYSLTIPSGKYNLTFSFLGFEEKSIEIVMDKNKKQDIELSESGLLVGEVVVTGEAKNKNVESIEMSVEKVQMKTIKALPAFMGEVDLMRTLELLPGIQNGGEGSSGLYVRGGGPDENLLLLDEAPVYNASHLMGFFSVFNSDAIKDIKVYKGGIPSQYGGKISSVIDIKMNDGNSKRFSYKGGISNISGRLTVEGPIIKDKWSYIVSGRRTWADAVGRLAGLEELKENKIYFYDLNAKTNYDINEKNKIFASAYTGTDYLSMGNSIYMSWGNITTTLRWNHIVNSKLFLNTTLLYSRYYYNLGVPGDGADSFDWNSKIRDVSMKFDFTWFVNPSNTVRYGVNAVHHYFEPGKIDAGKNSYLNDFSKPVCNALEYAAYINNEQTFSPRFSVNYGIRLSMFQQIGDGQVVNYNADDLNEKSAKDTVPYAFGKVIKSWPYIEPRLSMKYTVDGTSSIKLSFNRMVQNLHLISNTNAPAPYDIWLPSTKYIKPLIGDQIAAGYFRNFRNNSLEASVEVYYKKMHNVIDYKDGADLFNKKFLETELLRGDAYSYGCELLLKKQEGRLTGWVSYTLSKTMRKINGINNDQEYHSTYDRPHDFSIIGTYELTNRWTLSGTWVYTSGNRTSYPESKYLIQGVTVSQFSKRNGYNIPDYHRLDLSVTYKLRNGGKRFEHNLNLSVYNVYGRRNAYSVTWKENEKNPLKMEATRLSIIGAQIPALTYNFNF